MEQTEKGEKINNIIKDKQLAMEYANLIGAEIRKIEINDLKTRKRVKKSEKYYVYEAVFEKVLEEFALLPHWKSSFRITCTEKNTLIEEKVEPKIHYETELFEEPIMTYRAVFTKKRETLYYRTLHTEPIKESNEQINEEYKRKIAEKLKEEMKEIERLEKEEKWKKEQINQYLHEKYIKNIHK